MAASIYPDYPPDITPEQSEYLLSNLKDWSIAHGLAVRPSPAFVSQDLDPTGVLANTAPVTLFPSPFPAACFQEAREIQTFYNKLYAAIAQDEEWLRGIVEEYELFFHRLISILQALIRLLVHMKSVLSICISILCYSVPLLSAQPLLRNMDRLIDVDDFIAKLWEIHLAVKKEGYVQVR